MSTTIDERVVSMEFDNRRFETNVATTLSTLDKLKQSLNLTGATKGLESVEEAARKVDMSPLGNAVETVRARFSALQVMGITALTNITNQAVNAGKRMVSALTIDPIKMGFKEYETQIGSVQTILANTQSKGSTLQDVNRALDELNTYADKTIYNFTEMTRNIGTFTAAGIELDKSVTSIKGIANLAAVSGSTSQQASTAMYQLSQALASGTVKLMDWNSVVNAGMGGQVFQDALKRTAKNMGTNVDAMIKKAGSFRESLKDGWITADVLTETLTQLSGAYDKTDLLAKGYSESQAKEILELADTAVQAATKVKTFTQLWDTLKESAQSGWTQTWEIMIGDFDEAKEALTKVSDVVGKMLNDSAEARNNLLSGGLSSGWKQLLGAGIADEAGFQDTIKEVAKNHGVNFDKMAKKNETFEQTLTRGLKKGKIDADMLSESVSKMTKKMSKMSDEELKAAGYTKEHVNEIKKLNKGLKDGSISMDEFVKKMMRPSGRQNIIDSLWNTFNALLSVVKPIKEAFSDIFPAATSDQIYQLTVNLKKFTEGLTLSGEVSGKIKRIFKGLFSIFDIARKGITAVVDALFDLSQSDGIGSLADFLLDAAASIGDFFTNLNESFDTDGLTGTLSKLVSGISSFIGGAVKGIDGFANILSRVGDFVVKVAGKIWTGIKTVFNWISENVSASDIFAGLAGGGIFLSAKKFMGFLDKIQDTLQNLFKKDDKGTTKFSDILNSVKDSLESFTSGIKVWSLVGIAAAVTLLSSSLRKISELDAVDIGKSLLSIGIMMSMLTKSFESITKTNWMSGSQAKGAIKTGIAMILMAKAIDILADSMVKLSELSLGEIAKGLIALGGAMGELVLGIKVINKVKIDLKTSVAMLALAESCKKLADALDKFGSMNWDEIGRGLTAMGGALAEFVAALAVLKKVGGVKGLLGSVGMLVAVQSLDKMADGLKKFGDMSWDEIKRGLAGMGGALAEVGAVTGLVGGLAGFSSIFGGTSLLISVQSLDDLAEGLKKFGEMSWDKIERGLVGMGGALVEVGAVTGALGYLTGFAGILGSGSILIAVQGLSDIADALKKFGSMSWDEIGRGLVAMGHSLGQVASVTGALGYLAGFSGIIGSGAILITIQGLDDLANALQKFGSMSWDEIKRGLVGMGGALTEVGVITGALGYLTGFAGMIGSGSILLAIQGLDDLANAFAKFGEMSWDEIGRGLSAMGGALGEVALGGFLSTLSGIGAMAISEVAEPLGILADSLKKWKDVTVPENLGWQLSQLANGVFSFTLGGSGASALATAAPAIGQMADSIKKWNGVAIPEGLSSQISSLSAALSGWWNEGMGASALATAAPAIGQMADSIKKWKDVSVPENLGEQMQGISDGIKAFTWAFMGGWSLSAVSGPLGELADDIKKWKDVSIPDGLSEDLSSLADGIKAFSWAFMGGMSLTSITGPLGDLATSVSKWKDISVPENLKTTLTNLADGVKAFSWAFLGGISLTSITGPLGDLADSVKKWKSVTVPKGLPTQLTNLAGALKAFAGVKNISYAATNLTTISNAIKNVSGVSFKSINSGISGFADSLGKLASSSSKIKGVGTTIVNNLVKPINNAGKKLSDAGTKMISALVKAINNKRAQFTEAGLELMSQFIKGLKKNKGDVKETMDSAVESAKTGARGYYSEFYSAGSYLVSGFANGISANAYKAAAKARAMAAAAARAAKSELDEHSPSRVGYKIGDFFGIAFVNAIGDNVKKAYKASTEMAASAKSGLNTAINKINNSLSAGIDTRPTIRPVLDLTDVESGASYLSGLLGGDQSVGLMNNLGAINSAIARRGQNGANDDVVSALKDLKKTIGKTGNTYVVDGVTYDDGSNIAEVIRALIRNIRIEGRV